MTYDATYKACKDCGEMFKRSRSDSTVRCPACRASRRRVAPDTTTFYAERAMEAKLRAYEARRTGDREAEAEATADYLHWRKLS